MSETHTYDDEFFRYINDGSLRSARKIVPLMVELARPKSVLDVGCGAGAWLTAWDHTTLERWIGVDGAYVNESQLLVPQDHFLKADLKSKFICGERFDLVYSLEVAEHVEAEYASTFVENLTVHGDIVIFSAAPPGQGGEFHVNEQPYNYWVRMFKDRGYDCFDCVRPKILTDNTIEATWYRYNMLLFANADGQARLPEAARAARVDAARDACAPALETAPDDPSPSPAERGRRIGERQAPPGLVDPMTSVSASPLWNYLLLFGAAVCAAVGQTLFKLGAANRTSLASLLNATIAIGVAFYLLGTILWIIALRKLPLSSA